MRAKVKLPLQSFRHAWGIVLVVTLAFPAAAQTSSSQTTQTSTPAAEQVADPLGRHTPRGTIIGFNLAVHRNDFVSAARYMQVSAAQRASTEALARDLTELMDRYYTQLVTAMSALPEGALNDGLPPNRERVGPLTIGGKSLDIGLVRVNELQAGPVWLISSETLAQVPALHEAMGESWVERLMPKPLVSHTFFGTSLAQWIVWAASIGIPLLLLWLVSRLSVVLARTKIGDPARRRLVDSWYAAARLPMVVLFTLAIQLAAMPFLGFSLGFRLGNGRIALGCSVAAFAWLIWRLLTLLCARARIVAQRMDQAGTKSLVLLGERVFKVLIILVAVFWILTIAGVDMTTALAGVGIGGIAVALGAQKSVENLLGGIFLLTDKALAVGDLCRISNRLGVVEDITLRSVRLRTPEQTLLSIPAGILAQANIENFATREKIPIQTILRLRYGTTAEQLRAALDGIHALLAQHPKLETETSRIRLVDFGANAIEFELFANVLTSDMLEFLSVREDLLLQIAVIVESAGSGFAQPTQFIYLDSKSGAEDQIHSSDGREPSSEADRETPTGNKGIGKRTN